MAVCHLVVNVLGAICGERADRTITGSNSEGPFEFPACGMHAMRFKPADGYGNEPLVETVQP